MQITILGVTRPAGTHAAKKALDNNHTVVALVRGGPDALPPSLKQHVNAENLKVVKGDATNTEDLKEATKGSDAILSFLGGRGSMKVNIARDCTKILVDILPPSTKVVMVSNVGIGQSRDSQNFIVKRFLLDMFMSEILEDKRLAEEMLRDSGIEKWTAIRAGWLSDRAEDLKRVKFVDDKNASVTSRASREDIAAVALKLVEGDYGDEHWGKPINLASTGFC